MKKKHLRINKPHEIRIEITPTALKASVYVDADLPETIETIRNRFRPILSFDLEGNVVPTKIVTKHWDVLAQAFTEYNRQAPWAAAYPNFLHDLCERVIADGDGEWV